MACQSMTGFGQGVYQDDTLAVKVEIRTVNHRFAECVVRMPRDLMALEDDVRHAVLQRVARGRAEVYITVEACAKSKTVTVDWALLRDIVDIEAQARTRLADRTHDFGGIAKHDVRAGHPQGEIDIAAWLRHPDIVTVRTAAIVLETIRDPLLDAVAQALGMLQNARAGEGSRLTLDLEAKIRVLTAYVQAIAVTEKDLVETRRTKLLQRVSALAVEVDENRLATEIALLADKASVDEELVRLQSHVDAFHESLAADGPVGRRLDFIIQEMHREVNTIGSKSTDIRVSKIIVDAKVLIEQLREQVQNIE